VTSFYEGFANITQTLDGTTLLTAKGCSVSGTNTSDFPSALEVASKADTVVFLGGLDLQIESEDKDRPDIRLPAIQVKLIQEISMINRRIVLVLLHGGMVGLDDVLGYVDAIVSLGYPGMYAGEILPKALYGIETRAWGKSTITWYKNAITEELNMLDFSMTRPPGRTYRYYVGEPNFRFGHGLNPLTTFALGEVAVRPSTCLDPLEYNHSVTEVHVALQVRNVGNSEGDEVVMAYFTPLDVPQSEPASKLREQLFGFERVHLKPGQEETISFSVDRKTLQLANKAGTTMTFHGRYIIQITNGSEWIGKTIEIDNNGVFLAGIDSSLCSERDYV
jgi:hypothetical protein